MLTALSLLATAALGPVEPVPGIWTTASELASLPTEGPAWESLLAAADAPVVGPVIADKDDRSDTTALAKALVHARTGEATYRQDVIEMCMAAIGSERGGNTLALARNLAGYVIAADLVTLPPDKDEPFRAWLSEVRHEELGGRTLISTHEDRPNNWGTHAGAARVAVARYLDDAEDLRRAADVFKGWLGDRDAYAGFDYGALDWQFDPVRPVGVNPLGARAVTSAGEVVSIDGVLPDDQRRSGPFVWPPPRENYVYEALQGALVQAAILHRAGYDAFGWEDQALRRAYEWLYGQAHYAARGDDTWQIHLVNHHYGTSFAATVPTRPGKNMGWTDWTHASP